MRRLCISLAVGFGFAATPAFAEPQTLDELLKQVQTGFRADKDAIAKREAQFRAAKGKQAGLLADAKKRLAAAQKRGDNLEKAFQSNEKKLADLEVTLRDRLGTMGELFGVMRQVAGDTRANLQSSLISAQHPGREKVASKLAESQSLPTIEELEELWFVLQQEMTESGKVVKFPVTVVSAKGEEKEQEVIRIGSFTAISGGKYLQWLSEVGRLAELGRQPSARFLSAASALTKAKSGFVPMAVDPSRGSILSLLVQTPSNLERVQVGGIIGYTVLSLGALALLLAAFRFLILLFTGAKVRSQIGKSEPKTSNPLGRIMKVYKDDPTVSADTLERKLDEAIVRESASLDSMLWVIKVVSVAAPLMGLLGTVTGMIRTFQAITLFGTGDPKLMAGGISEALVTTMLGLVVAIPLVLVYSGLASMSRRIGDILEEQSAGLVAVAAEAHDREQEAAASAD